MRKIKINGKTGVDLDNNRSLTLFVYYKTYTCFYDLQLSDYSNLKNGYGLECQILCEGEKSLSTINKYATKYGVRFV